MLIRHIAIQAAIIMATDGCVEYDGTNYYKYLISYSTPSAKYKIENLAPGVYTITYGGQVKVVVIKKGKKVAANFKAPLDYPDSPSFDTEISGTKAKGQKLTALAHVTSPSFGGGLPKFSYYWTNGTKILSKKAALKITKTTAKKNLWLITVSTYQKYAEASRNVVPGSKYGVVGFNVAVSGTFKKGKTVKAVISNKEVTGAKYTYQWLRGGKAIKGATKEKYKLTAKDKGKKISVKVTGAHALYTSKAVKTKAVKSK